jgi:DNA-binding NarL/FixJ family response regulator
MIRILLADDHSMFLQGLKMILAGTENLEVVSLAGNGEEVVQAVRAGGIDLVILDINMPVLSGYEATLQLAKEFPQIPVLALSMLGDNASVLKMLEAGAGGYLFKNADEAELLQAIEIIAAGGYYVTPEMQPVLLQFEKRERDKQRGYLKYDAHPLSTREVEILGLIMNGLTNLEIADKLFLSPRTVDTHRKNILAKLELKNTAALVKYAMEKRAFLGL